MEFGKFKDATSLLDGYLNLEKAFTKKCQELSELEKKADADGKVSSCIVENKELPSVSDEPQNNYGASENESGTDSAIKVDESQSAENNEGELIGLADKMGDEAKKLENSETAVSSVEPITEKNVYDKFKSPQWKEEVAKFFASNPEASGYKEKIAKVIASKPEIAGLTDCLTVAYALVSSSKGNPAQEKPNAEPNKPSKEQVLNEYFEDLLKRKNVRPSVLNGNASALLSTPPKKFSNMSDAGDYLLKNYFK